MASEFRFHRAVSVGENCCSAKKLRLLGFAGAQLPWDWVNSTSGIVTRAVLEPDSFWPKFLDPKNVHRRKNEVLGVKMVHLPEETLTPADIDDFRRRIHRWRHYVEDTRHACLFVLTTFRGHLVRSADDECGLAREVQALAVALRAHNAAHVVLWMQSVPGVEGAPAARLHDGVELHLEGVRMEAIAYAKHCDYREWPALAPFYEAVLRECNVCPLHAQPPVPVPDTTT